MNSNKKRKTKTKQKRQRRKGTLIYRRRLDDNNIEARLLSQEVIFLQIQDAYLDFVSLKTFVAFYCDYYFICFELSTLRFQIRLMMTF